MAKYTLSDKIDKINGVGEVYKNLLNKLEIRTIEDLLLHIPFRYIDRSQISSISELILNQEATIKVTVLDIKNIFIKYRGMVLTKAKVADETGTIEIIWFNQKFIVKSIAKSDKVILHGKVNENANHLALTNPDWEVIGENESQINGITPVYPLTEGLSSKFLLKRVSEILKEISIPEIIPSYVLEEQEIQSRESAINNIHFPKKLEDIEPAKYRLAFEELLFMHLHGIRTKAEWESQKNGHQIRIDDQNIEKFKSTLGFELTQSQLICINEVLTDLHKEFPMNRLLQGDVGSGKTAVAEIAILASLLCGYNAILLAPTQILAQQHFAKISKHLKEFKLETILLTGGEKIPKIESITPHLIIATHSILYNLNDYENVGLIVIDEQHKFGVEQRTKIVQYYSQNGLTPNLLTMTATPIPRSLALTFYGDLHLSLITELPIGRKQTLTKVIKESNRKSAYSWIYKEIKEKDNQVFVVCPFIEESLDESLKDVKSAEIEFEKISGIFKEFKVGLVHGKIKNKDEIIQKFKDKELDILVATPVIEVGIDIPSANIMVIENPERFGLASLHQLRGRVGRGGDQGYCLLFANKDESGIERLKNMETIYNGAQLAEIDMKIRGPGNIYGTEQHGYVNLKIADITDFKLVKTTKETAETLYSQIDLYPEISQTINSRFIVDKQ